jgi:hypothetical protein
MDKTTEQPFFVVWDYLTQYEMQDRIDWLRENLTAGDDWGFCAETRTCVFKNESASIFYRMRWFEAGKQTDYDMLLQTGIQDV